jgi:hypothetical protein
MGVGREDSQSGRLSDVRTLGPRLREDDGKESWLSAALVNARRAIRTLNSYEFFT